MHLETEMSKWYSGMSLGLERLGARLYLHIWHNDLFSLLGTSLLGAPPKETSNRKHKQFGPFCPLLQKRKWPSSIDFSVSMPMGFLVF